MRAWNDQELALLRAEVDELVTRWAPGLLDGEPGKPVARDDSQDSSDPMLRESWLAALNTLLAVQTIAEQLTLVAVRSAAVYGADYNELGAATAMSRQSARRRWPGLTGIAEARTRKLAWLTAYGDDLFSATRLLLDFVDLRDPGADADGPESAGRSASGGSGLRRASDWFAAAGEPNQRLDRLGLLLFEAYGALARLDGPARSGPGAPTFAVLGALLADGYAAMGADAEPAVRFDPSAECAGGAGECWSPPVVVILAEDGDLAAACPAHAIKALRASPTVIVAAYGPGVAPALLRQAREATGQAD